MKALLNYRLIVLCFTSINSYGDAFSSNITLPVNVNLKAVENKINQSIPSRIETIDMKDHTCVEAKWLKTKGIPNCSMKGIKIYCKDSWIKTVITPSISCNVDGTIDRDGPVTLAGKEASLFVTVPIKASVTARGLGIQQTVIAATEITASLTPTIDENWNVSVVVDTNYRWTKEPEIRLFNLIPVTISSQVDPVLKKELSKLKDTLPSVVEEAKIKENVDKAWRDLQQPQLIDKKTKTYFLFEPQDVGFSQINVSNNIMQASFNVTGHPQILSGTDVPNVDVKPLPKLAKVTVQNPEIFIELPIGVKYKEIENQANGFLEKSEPVDLSEFGYNGFLNISNINLIQKKERLKMDVDLRITKSDGWLKKLDVFGWLDVIGTVTFNLKPNVDSEKNIVYMTDFTLDSNTDNVLADVLVDVANLKPIRSMIEKQLSYNFTKDVDSARTQLTQVLNSKLSEDVSLVGNVTSISIQNVITHEKELEVPIRLIAAATLNIGTQ